jgi:putative oxidoreductase
MKKIDHILTAIGTRLQCLVLLAIRLYLGWQLFLIGKGKLLNIDRTAGYFATLPYVHYAPKLNVILAGSAECFGGLLLLVGLFSRFAGLVVLFTMAVAYVTGEPEALHAVFSNPDKFLKSDPLPYLVLALLVFCFGPGKIALDSLFGKKSASN